MLLIFEFRTLTADLGKNLKTHFLRSLGFEGFGVFFGVCFFFKPSNRIPSTQLSKLSSLAQGECGKFLK